MATALACCPKAPALLPIATALDCCPVAPAFGPIATANDCCPSCPAFKPIAIAFASEAYVLTAPVNKTVIDEDGVYLDDSFRPSVNPDSKECVVINFETAKEQGIMYWEIIKIGDLKDLSLIQDLKLEPKTESEALGILSNLLEENYSEVTELAKKANINFNTN